MTFPLLVKIAALKWVLACEVYEEFPFLEIHFGILLTVDAFQGLSSHCFKDCKWRIEEG